ncbi:MAG: lactate utilization protein [Clostridia bacterium]|nr:lactate utilization protein [Clostridia bacterium]
MQNNKTTVERLIEALSRNNMQGIYVEKTADIVKTVEAMLFEGCVITAGGSVSVKESGVWDLISKPCYEFFDRTRAGISEEERLEAFRQAIGCDFFFCSANAITEQGELVNVDGFGNRVASITFGPKKVIMIVGINKLVKNIDEAFLRIKSTAAPKNCVRLGIDSPCAKLGKCVSLAKSGTPDITDGCDFSRRICASYLVSGRQQEKNRITVIICGEPLGY